MEASHVALFASTGNVVIGVFQTLSAGKAGQLVPGNVGPATRGDTTDVPARRVTALDAAGEALSTNAATTSDVPTMAAIRMRVINSV
jgi:hypothetical protein